MIPLAFEGCQGLQAAANRCFRAARLVCRPQQRVNTTAEQGAVVPAIRPCSRPMQPGRARRLVWPRSPPTIRLQISPDGIYREGALTWGSSSSLKASSSVARQSARVPGVGVCIDGSSTRFNAPSTALQGHRVTVGSHRMCLMIRWGSALCCCLHTCALQITQDRVPRLGEELGANSRLHVHFQGGWPQHQRTMAHTHEFRRLSPSHRYTIARASRGPRRPVGAVDQSGPM